MTCPGSAQVNQNYLQRERKESVIHDGEFPSNSTKSDGTIIGKEEKLVVLYCTDVMISDPFHSTNPD